MGALLSRRLADERGGAALRRVAVAGLQRIAARRTVQDIWASRPSCRRPSQRHALDFSGAPVFSLAALIPLILVLMTVTGAVYPAIDLTAGERERGTLEMLIAAPVPRVGLLLGEVRGRAGGRAA